MIPRDPRSIAALVHDLVAATIAWCAAYWLRFNLDIPELYVASMFENMFWIVPLQGALFLGFGLYRGIWRYASVSDIRRIVLAAAVATMALSMILLVFTIPNVPRSVLLLDPLLLVMIMGGSRLAYRGWKERSLGLSASEAKPVLVLGAGDAAADLIKNLTRSREWRVVGLLDDNAAKLGRQINGVTVFGKLDLLSEQAKRLGVEQAIIAMPGANHTARRRALQLCSDAGVRAMTVPSFDDIVSGKVTVSQIRNIELDDLLGRDPVRLDSSGLSTWLSGQTVAVTGAGGSIGSELARQLERFSPARLVLIEANEYALYRLVEDFAAQAPAAEIIPVIADTRNEARLDQVFAQFKPSVLFHAAAYKHVPLMENLNAWEAVQNNIGGTLQTARAAVRAGIAKFVLISTDKAVNPTNVMGATKRVAELLCRSLPDSQSTRFITVRFGNVLGSTGSVIPKFREQIARGGPVTVTHPEITRYFMSIPEAAQLVLQAGLMGTGGEIFVLDMGEPVRIADLARDMIRLSGFSEQDIRIEFSGLRPGEKLYEELLADDELTLPTPHPKLRVAKATDGLSTEGFAQLLVWLDGPLPPDDAAVRAALMRVVPEYKPA